MHALLELDIALDITILRGVFLQLFFNGCNLFQHKLYVCKFALNLNNMC